MSVHFFLSRFLFERRLRAHGVLHGFLHQPGDHVDGEERPAGRPQPVPPEPALRLHPDTSAEVGEGNRLENSKNHLSGSYLLLAAAAGGET